MNNKLTKSEPVSDYHVSRKRQRDYVEPQHQLTERRESHLSFKRERESGNSDKYSYSAVDKFQDSYDQRRRQRMSYNNSNSRMRQKPGNYFPSFLAPTSQKYPPSKRGGEEELRVLDSGKLRKKIYLPRKNGVNYIGLLIGPRGMYQKKLEEETNCKILIRGNLPLLKRANKEHGCSREDNDHEHVLIITDNKESLRKAESHIFRIIQANEDERNQIRQEQLKAALKISQTVYDKLDESLLTPYGPPSPFANIMPVPNECVGLIIGRGGETIRQLQMETGAKIQVAKGTIPGTNMRNVFIEGPPEKYEIAKKCLEEVVEEYKNLESDRDRKNYHSKEFNVSGSVSKHRESRYQEN